MTTCIWRNRGVVLSIVLGASGCRCRHSHGSDRRVDPCGPTGHLMVAARAAAKSGFLERALVLYEQHEDRCPGVLRGAQTSLRSDWLVQGGLRRYAVRWVNSLRSDASADPREASDAQRAAAMPLDDRTSTALVAEGAAAAANRDIVAARRLYTRAIDAFERQGNEPIFDREFDRAPSDADARVLWSFAATSGYFVEGKLPEPREADALAGGEWITAWGLARDGYATLQLRRPPAPAGRPLVVDVAATPTGIVLFRDTRIEAWNPLTGERWFVAFPRLESSPDSYRPSISLVSVSADGRLVAWDGTFHRTDTRSARSFPADALAMTITPDRRTLTIASTTNVSAFAVPDAVIGDSAVGLPDPPVMARRWSTPIAALPGESTTHARVEVGMTHAGNTVLTRDDDGLTVYSVTEEGRIAVVRRLPGFLGAMHHAINPRPRQIQFSGDDRWVLFKDGVDSRVLPFPSLAEPVHPCTDARWAAGFLRLAGREWIVTGYASTWRLTALPTSEQSCGQAVPVIELTRLEEESHGVDALELFAKLPCEDKVMCPPSGVRTLLEIRWINDREKKATWMSAHYGCHAGATKLPWSVCALRFETEDLIGYVEATSIAEAAAAGVTP